MMIIERNIRDDNYFTWQREVCLVTSYAISKLTDKSDQAMSYYLINTVIIIMLKSLTRNVAIS